MIKRGQICVFRTSLIVFKAVRLCSKDDMQLQEADQIKSVKQKYYPLPGSIYIGIADCFHSGNNTENVIAHFHGPIHVLSTRPFYHCEQLGLISLLFPLGPFTSHFVAIEAKQESLIWGSVRKGSGKVVQILGLQLSGEPFKNLYGSSLRSSSSSSFYFLF